MRKKNMKKYKLLKQKALKQNIPPKNVAVERSWQSVISFNPYQKTNYRSVINKYDTPYIKRKSIP